MTNEQAYELIGKRAKQIAESDSVKSKCEEMFNAGMSIEDIQSMVTKMAIATLIGA